MLLHSAHPAALTLWGRGLGYTLTVKAVNKQKPIHVFQAVTPYFLTKAEQLF